MRSKCFAVAAIMTLVICGYAGAQEEKQKTSSPEIKKIAVLDLEGKNIPQTDADIVSDFLRRGIVDTQKYIVIEKKKIAEMLKEQKAQLSGCTSTECAVDIGKILNVEQIVTGSVNKLSQKYYLNIRVIDIESGKVIKTEEGACDNIDQLKNISKQLALIIIEEIKRNDLSKNKDSGRSLIQQTNAVTAETIKKTGENMTTKTVVSTGDSIEVEYEGSLKDGRIFDSSRGRAPLAFKVGAGQMIKGFDSGVVGMKISEERIINIKAADAYGERDEKMIQKFPKSFFPKDYKLEKGAEVGLKHQNGQQIQAIITDITGESVLLDFNHFLSGKDLIFRVKVISIK